MKAKSAFEHRCTVVLPIADNYYVEDVLKLLSFAIRNRLSSRTAQQPEPSTSRGNVPSHIETGECSARITLQSDVVSKCDSRPEQTPNWDERTTQLMLALIQRLHRAACNKDLELWSLSNEVVKEPPSDPNDIAYWATTSTIFRSDLLKFCEGERVNVQFDGEEDDGDSVIDRLRSGSSVQISGGTAPSMEKGLPPIPGKIPSVAIGKLAVAAAWEIEFELGRSASPSEVIQRLRKWVESRDGDCLRPSDKKNCVHWETVHGRIKAYDMDACAATLRTWRASRAKATPDQA